MAKGDSRRILPEKEGRIPENQRLNPGLSDCPGFAQNAKRH